MKKNLFQKCAAVGLALTLTFGTAGAVYAEETPAGEAEIAEAVPEAETVMEQESETTPETILETENHLTLFAAGTQDSSRQIYEEVGSSAELAVDASADDMEGLEIRWYIVQKNYHEDGELYADEVLIEGAEGASYTAEDIKGKQEFAAVAEDKYGNEAKVQFFVDAGDYGEELELVKATEVALDDVTVFKMFSFTPKENGAYQFVSDSDEDTCAVLYDENMNEMSVWDVGIGNFSIFYELEAGKTYYYRTYFYDGITGSYIVRLYQYRDNKFSISADQTYPIAAPESDVTLSVTPKGRNLDNILYKWYRRLDNGEKELLSEFTGNTCLVKSITASGSYLCEATDQYGNKSLASMMVTVDNELVLCDAVTKGAEALRLLQKGTGTELKVKATALNTTGMKYQWKYCSLKDYYGSGIYEDLDAISGATKRAYTVDSIDRPCKYVCTANDAYGNDASVTYYLYNASDVKTLKSNQEVSIDFDENYNMALYKFVPKTSESWSIHVPSYNGLTLVLADDSFNILKKQTIYYGTTFDNELKAGKTYYFAVMVDDYYMTPYEADFIFEKTAGMKTEISEAVVTAKSVTYNGKSHKPEPTVKLFGVTLTKDVDYTVEYKRNKNAGLGKIVITGIGDYEGTAKGTFKIKPKTVSPTVELSKTSYVYNGKARKPAVTVKDGSKKLTADTDYKVTYASGRKTPGRYKVTVSLTGNYTGTDVVSYFTIRPKGTTLTSVKSGAAGSGKITVKWKKQTTQTTGYEIRYNVKGSSKTKTVIVADPKATSKKITGLTAGKTYEVKIRTYKKSGKKTIYSGWSSVYESGDVSADS